MQSLERKMPKAAARELEKELSRSAPIAYGRWVESTPQLLSRLRAIQRWRLGLRGRGAVSLPRTAIPYLWPVGERQRREVEPSFPPSALRANGTWRFFLYNCGPEVVRDSRVFLDDEEIDYAPSILTGRFAEVHWQRVEAVRGLMLATDAPSVSRHRLDVEFVIARGTRQAKLSGELTLDTQQGWTFFGSRDGRRRELE